MFTELFFMSDEFFRFSRELFEFGSSFMSTWAREEVSRAAETAMEFPGSSETNDSFSNG